MHHATSGRQLVVENARLGAELLPTLGRVVKRRFVDDGRWLASFAGEFVVVCPRCHAAAVIRRQWEPTRFSWSPAIVFCSACGFSRRQQGSAGTNSGRGRRCVPDGWSGPVAIFGKRRCGNCGRRMTIRRRADTVLRHPVIPLTCDGCGAMTNVSYEMYPLTVPRALVDSCFGLSLRLQAPCAGRVLWAFNADHLAYLKEYLEADLRERRVMRNASVASRLPGWLKSAKHRDEAVRAAQRLEMLLPKRR
jgi:hypothetical protein